MAEDSRAALSGSTGCVGLCDVMHTVPTCLSVLLAWNAQAGQGVRACRTHGYNTVYSNACEPGYTQRLQPDSHSPLA